MDSCLSLGLHALSCFLSRREALTPVLGRPKEVMGAFDLAAGPHV